MKIADFSTVEKLVLERNELVGKRDEGRFALVVDNRVQAPDLIGELMPAIRVVLNGRINAIDQQLIKYGVELD